SGYGYIEKSETVGDGGYRVSRFLEKRERATARDYVASGNYYWNSGMFMLRASRYLEELEQFQHAIYAACSDALAKAEQDLHFVRVNRDAFEACPDDSIDYAVMERTTDAVMVPLDAKWSDVGSWTALWEAGDKDSSGNCVKGDVLCENSRNSYIHAEHRLVATVGVDDLVVVETKDAVLVAHKEQVQHGKEHVEKLQLLKRGEHLNHREVYRPWGVYDSIDQGDRYQVKRITVKPGAKLSVQMHHHRAEHWVVVCGTAKVTNG